VLEAISPETVCRWSKRPVLLYELYAVFQLDLSLLVEEDPFRSALGRDAGTC
jgi:hypothetical protein